MALDWRLKKWLVVQHDIYRPVELQRLLQEKAGYSISLQAVAKLMNETPKQLKIETIQAICNALDCKLSDFCEVFGEPSNKVD